MHNQNVTRYPFVFFPVGLNLRDRLCVVIGDDAEANEKSESLREAGAQVTRFPDATAIDEGVVCRAFFVLSTPQDEALCGRLRALADEHRFLLCCIDQPRFGFVAMQALVKAGPARIAISTGGIAPRVGKRIKESLQQALDATFVRFLDCLNAQRERNRERLGESAQRRAAMIAAADGFDLEVTVRYPEWFQEAQALSGAQLAPEIGAQDA
ncbi:MAG TPA: NAD(P)-dependent oxidoreductase [Candidatus Baltobacteraceae bacterium]